MIQLVRRYQHIRTYTYRKRECVCEREGCLGETVREYGREGRDMHSHTHRKRESDHGNMIG